MDRRTVHAWLFVAALVALAATLGGLQYHWIGEVSRAERERLRNTLQTSLSHLSRDFDYELGAAATALAPEEPIGRDPEHEADFVAHWQSWKASNARSRAFKKIYLIDADNGVPRLRALDSTGGSLHDAEWPESFATVRDRFERRLSGERGGRFGGFLTDDQPDLMEVPVFAMPAMMEPSRSRRGRGGPPPQPRREFEWLLVQVDFDYIAHEMLPELVRRHLGAGAYQVQVVGRNPEQTPIYKSDANVADLAGKADASVMLFGSYPETVLRRNSGFRGRFGMGNGGPPRESGPQMGAAAGGNVGDAGPASTNWRPIRRREDREGGGGPGGPGPGPGGFERGRWQMFARHTAGSLEVLVARTRTNNLVVSSAILLLMIAAGTALLHYTRRSQRLAELQMEFVASVSHELRTPLSVMRTAGHNLQGRVATDPERVKRYGALIQDESEKLTVMVEQVLRFANSKLGRVIGAKELVEIDSVIESALQSDRRVLQESGCRIEKEIPETLPQILGDATTLKHAIQNIVTNAAKYGSKGGWIGILVSAAGKADSPEIEIRIADKGDGIPADEIGMIFEAFYRGKRAVSDQIHGTGLGLSLTKRIVEAHGGTITVRSELGQGTEFLIRLPAVAGTQSHEFAHTAD